jgi:hypothetical protein
VAATKATHDLGDLGVVIGTAHGWEATARSPPPPRGTGNPLVLTASDKIVLVARRSDRTIAFERKNTIAGGDNSQISITDGANGKIKFGVSSANSSGMVRGERIPFEIRYVLASDPEPRSLCKGVFVFDLESGAPIP